MFSIFTIVVNNPTISWGLVELDNWFVGSGGPGLGVVFMLFCVQLTSSSLPLEYGLLEGVLTFVLNAGM